MNDHDELRRDLADSYRRVVDLGLNELSSGNISARVEGGMLISPSGASGASIRPESFVFVRDDGRWDDVVDGRKQKASSEWRMHLGVYVAHPSAGAVVHTHSDSCVALAAHNRPLPGFTYVVGFFGGSDVPCVPYNTFGSEALAVDAAAALEHRSACLLGNHGMLARARDIHAAVDDAHRLEILCRQYLTSLQIGEPDLLTDAEWTAFFDQAIRLSYGQEP